MTDIEVGRLTMLKLPGDEFITLELIHDPTTGPFDPGGRSRLSALGRPMRVPLTVLSPMVETRRTPAVVERRMPA